MSELRQDPTTGAFVIIAPDRGRRPEVSKPTPAAEPLPRFDAACPFCPGNEAMLPGISAETPAKDAPGWSVRVVPNKFPALIPRVLQHPATEGAHTVRTGYGYHEIIIESSRHDADLTTLDGADMRAVVAAYRQRFVELSERAGIAAVVLFRNRGARSGASLVHPHAQAIALPLVPPKLQAMADWAARQSVEMSGCPTCVEIAHELTLKERIVEERRHFVALVPFAAERPSEQWLVPRRHYASFAESSEAELDDLALLLQRALRRLKTAHGNPPYSFSIESAGPGRADASDLHWRLRIAPDLVTWGGFEGGSGLPINSSAPEADAALLRASLAGEG